MMGGRQEMKRTSSVAIAERPEQDMADGEDLRSTECCMRCNLSVWEKDRCRAYGIVKGGEKRSVAPASIQAAKRCPSFTLNLTSTSPDPAPGR